MPNFGYHLARAQGAAFRRVYAACLPAIVRRPIRHRRALPFEVYSYSGEAALPEQVGSIRSLLRHAGSPKKFTVVSDGTYSPRSRALLQALDPVVQVADALPSAEIPADLRPYLTAHPTGRQLALIMSLPIAGPALYVDSDVLFFPGAAALSSFAPEQNLYLTDCRLSADERLLHAPEEGTHPVNTGVLFLAHPLDCSLGLERFRQLSAPPTFFTNQTIAHLALHADGAKAFDPEKFVLQLDDQFVYPDCYASRALVLRHYVNPVRHKFWTAMSR